MRRSPARCRNRPSPPMPRQGLRRRAWHALLAGEHAGTAEADQHLLQPGRARLRDLDRRRVPAGERPARRGRGRRRRQPARCAADLCAPQEAKFADAWFRTITARSIRLKRCAGTRSLGAACLLLASAGRRLGAAPMRRLVPYQIVGDAIPASLTGSKGDRGARPRDRRRPQARALPAVPFRPVSGGQVPGQYGARSSRRRRALERRAIAAAHRRCEQVNPSTIMPPYYRIDGLDPGGGGAFAASRCSGPRRSRTWWPF